MRQGQQHRRGRGRNNNNNRRGHNPLSRSFESNGPDVKVRGTPAHIAEKYLSLARDAQSSGDPVLAENYLQHAEHYNRIIMAYREQQMQHSGGEMMNGNGPRMRQGGPGDVGEADDAMDDEMDDAGQDQPPMQRFQSDQPRFTEQRGDDGRHQRGPDHQHRFRDRQDRQDRHGDRSPDMRQRDSQDMRQGRDRQGEPQAEGGQPRQDQFQRRRERFGPGNEQPEFLRRPVRRPRRDGGNGEAEAPEGGHDGDPQDKSAV